MERYQWALRFWAAFAELKEKEECNNIFVDHCILVHLLKEMVPRIVKTGEETKNNNADSKKGQFVIVHPDLHAGNIFVDDDFNITGILDWSGASTGSLAQLLASVRFKSVHAPQPSLEAAFREGFEKGYIDRKGADDKRTTYSSGYTLSAAQWEKVEIVGHVDSLARMGIDSGKEHYYNFRQLYKLIYGKQIDDKRIDSSSSAKATDDSKLAIDSNVNQPVNHDTSFTSDGDGSTVGNSSITSDTSMTDTCNATDDGNTMSTGGSQAIEDSFDCVCDRKVGSIDDNKTGSGQRTEKISGGYEYDPIISKLFCKQRGMPYAQTELARLNKEDEEAGDKDEGKEEEEEEEAPETRCVGLAGAVANKLAVMDSINPNFFPDRRLWKWIGNALAQQMYHDIFEKKKKEGLGSVAAFLEARKKQEAKEALEENGKSRKRARRK